tara:strand:+ start:409 stop:636 length:228 start_codon:yes stop_codon:yes gene_type:complete
MPENIYPDFDWIYFKRVRVRYQHNKQKVIASINVFPSETIEVKIIDALGFYFGGILLYQYSVPYFNQSAMDNYPF